MTLKFDIENQPLTPRERITAEQEGSYTGTAVPVTKMERDLGIIIKFDDRDYIRF